MERIGRYTLVGLLGEGGQGQVWRAEVRIGTLTRTVALKVLRGDGLVREARLGSLLRHPHWVDVYEVGEADGVWFCAMELCGGGSLRDWMPLPPRAVVDVGLQVCAALRFAHEEVGLVHLDLKPDNLLLDGATVKVADLGIALARGFEVERGLRGTPRYMSPEQAQGGSLDVRTDVWALGVTLRELATGASAAATGTFEFDDTDDFFDDDDDDEPAPAQDWLEPILAVCLAPDPADRFASMEELAAALARLPAEGRSLAQVLELPSPAPPPSGAPLGVDDAFVGRERELAELSARLAGPGVIALKGGPGMGKTRLACAAADAWRAQTGGQAWLCELAEARDSEGAAVAVARALGVPLGKADPVDLVGHAISGRGEVVMVLDTFDALAAQPEVLQRWCAAAPRARWLVTSRDPVRIPGVATVEVGPLDEDAAVRLLAERALLRGVEVADEPATRELARRLDGLPLALELAAGRLGVLSVSEVLTRLSPALLRSGSTGVADRHATLRAALDWSWRLLDARERRALAALSVFRGGFGLEAAEAVAGAGAPELSNLADRSLVISRGGRLALLEPVRGWAADHLDDPEPSRRHALFYAAYGADDALEALGEHGGAARWQALVGEVENLTAACRWALRSNEPVLAAATCRAIGAVTTLRGPFALTAGLAADVLAMDLPAAWAGRVAIVAAEADRLLRRLQPAAERLEGAAATLRAAGDRRAEGLALAALGVAYHDLGRFDQAFEAAEAALDRHRSLGHRRAEGVVLMNLAVQWHDRGRVDEAERCASAALAAHREVGNRRSEGTALGNLAQIAHAQGRVDEARAAHEAALAVHREIGNRRFEGLALNNLGVIHHHQGRFEQARATLESALQAQREVGDRRFEGMVLINLGNLALTEGRGGSARVAWEEALRASTESGDLRGRTLALGNLAGLCDRAGDLLAARGHLEAALAIAAALGDQRLQDTTQEALSSIARRQGLLDEA